MKKLEICVQTEHWYDAKNPEESIRFIKECGFESLDFNINKCYSDTFDKERLTSMFDKDLEELYAYYQPLKEAAGKYGITFSLFHGAFPMYYAGEDARNEQLIRATEKMFAIAEYLNCKYVVVHPWSGPDMHKEDEKQVNLKLYCRLMPAAKKYGVVICLENLFKHYDLDCFDAACSSAEELCWYIDTLNTEAGEELFGACVDVGHVHVTTGNLYQYITTVGKRLKTLHIHDNDGISDSHMIPYTQMDRTGRRLSINWEHFIRGLREIEYEGALSFETFRAIDMLPAAIQGEGLRFIAAIGRYFRSCVAPCSEN